MKVALDRIRQMNEVFDLPSNDWLTDRGKERLQDFKEIMLNEIHEADDIGFDEETGEIDFTALADWLTDILVYTLSEARGWGIPIEPCFDAVMNSQESKLVDGKAVMIEGGRKFGKGPDYVPPEPEIDYLLQKYRKPNYTG